MVAAGMQRVQLLNILSDHLSGQTRVKRGQRNNGITEQPHLLLNLYVRASISTIVKIVTLAPCRVINIRLQYFRDF